jgi:DtxR family Mn-dependent transcriptional regulator
MSEYLGFVIIVVCIALLFWPRFGVFWRCWQDPHTRTRILIEDALKYLCFCETSDHPATLTGVAGRLQVAESQSAELIQAMQQKGLVYLQGERLQLTAAGRAYAMRVLRFHRLWELYLAHETGYSEKHWHAKADRREHQLSPREADRIAAHLGNPLVDPHGDPIPTKQGDMISIQGQPLITLPSGTLTRVVHLEDEPEAVYTQIVAAGFYPGSEVELLENTPQHVRIRAAGHVHTLSPLAAAAITVESLAEQGATSTAESLADLRPRQSGRVIELSPRCRGAERRRLLDLGIVPGTLITAELVSPSGDPTAYRVRDTLIALRRDQAKWIEIQREQQREQQRAGAATNGKAEQ